MSITGYIPPYLAEGDLRTLVIDALGSSPERSIETFHARFHHPERGLTADDVVHGLEGPWIYERPPTFNKDEWQWKYRIATESIDGDDIVIIIAVDTLNRSFDVVTRWR